MAISTPSAPQQAPESVPDAGVIEDARARQRRHRRITGLVSLVAAATMLLALGFTGGHGGGGGRHQARGTSGGGGSPSSGHGSVGYGFPGAPATQPGSLDWAESNACPLARPNRYLPAHSGCVTVTRADVFGGGRQDLIIIYSKLGRKPFSFPAGSRHITYQAKQAMLKIVRPGGATQTTPIRSAKAASMLAVAHVNNNPGAAVFIQTAGISSGSWGTIYDAYHGRLVHAGDFAYGGDSGAQAEIACLPSNPPKLIQFILEPVGTLNRPWKGTKITYVWRQGRLARVAERKLTVSSRSIPILGGSSPIGVGCLVGIGAYATASGAKTTPARVPTPAPIPAPAIKGLLGRHLFLDSAARWNGTLYGSGYYDTQATNPLTAPARASRGCRISCDPTIWAWSPKAKRWRLMFVNHGTPGGSDLLLATGGSLLDFTTSPGTRLFRTTNGSTYTLTRLPAAMTAGVLTEVYRAGGSLVAIVMHGNQGGFENAPVVWTSTNGLRWIPAEPVSAPG